MESGQETGAPNLPRLVKQSEIIVKHVDRRGADSLARGLRVQQDMSTSARMTSKRAWQMSNSLPSGCLHNANIRCNDRSVAS
mmetsp:Transcript_64918/g.155059  ORF Transcript_64918/g.155059 Transcript_64918/m.155059 type:complete len:82 (+) Transcript_64918:1076-1321(+)